ncbi:hypothetical protein D7B24_005149 [Verticillium nonalfalfae]|uniref:Uncharacterized protein n=1 Tax=Verticillium nonalfalfae TaxID=1051616 RepID=A0A3M9YE55_9PEZI|nr:uncharacterized protein D7B24_005149 [Verticillium nonalfalfae]RNJ58192.1 hypothetical protein D7B24_005149 [Verticillium nonalfalfae]
MTSLPSQHPTLSLHLSDRNLHPILTSARSDTQLEALTSLATTSLTAHAAAHRLALGHPQRLMVEHGPGAPVVLTSYLDPAAALSSSPAHTPTAARIASSATSPRRAGSPSTGAGGIVVTGPPAASSSLNPAAVAAAADPSPSTLAHSALAPPTDLLAAVTLSSAGSGSGSDPTATATTSSRPNGVPPPRSRPHTRDSGRAASSAAAAATPPAKRKQTAPHSRSAQDGLETSAADAAPMLIGLVVAGTAEEALEARRAAVRLERVAREVQREWTVEENRRYDSDESG